MKHSTHLFLAILFISYVSTIAGAIGCMNNSYGNKKQYDPKTYHYVQCNCPCGSNSSRYDILTDRGKCRECGHYHALLPIKIIRGSVGQVPRKPVNIFGRYFRYMQYL